MKATFDVAIVGSGFGGSLLALICRRIGLSVILFERGSHPRFAIGESSTPLANLLLEELARRYELPQLLPFTKWGTWQRKHPEIACGLKRGFTFLQHRIGSPFELHPDRRNQLLVAASPHDDIADTHWYRADFDYFLVREAQAAGVEYMDRTELSDVQFAGNNGTLTGRRIGQEITVGARLIIDASGPRGFLHNALQIGEVPVTSLPSTQALYSHFTGAHRLAELLPFGGDEQPPFPIDDAAVHHVFDGGWIWVLRFNNGVTSAGAAVTSSLARELDLHAGPAAWDRLLDRLPTVKEQFKSAQPQMEFHYTPSLSFQSRRAARDQWALLPSAAGFTDPLLSTGIPLTLFGISRLANILEHDWGTSRISAAFARYEMQTAEELSATNTLIAALYANLNNFPLFAALTRIYFAAASFSETARRLERPQLTGSFLMHDVPAFGPLCRKLAEQAMRMRSASEQQDLIDRIEATISPYDVAGLCDRSRGNWHPADAADLFDSAHKLAASRSDIEAMLKRAGFYQLG